MSAAFSFTNTSSSEHNVVTAKNLGLATNYVLKKEDPSEVVISNKTAALDQAEHISYRFSNIEHVNGGSVKVTYPAPNNSGVKYNVRLDNIYRESISETRSIIDHPISIQLTVMHELTGCIDNDVIKTELKRLLGALYDETKQDYRFMDMARGAIQPTSD